jgi:hypothetical protein
MRNDFFQIRIQISDTAKSFGTDRIRIRIHNTVLNSSYRTGTFLPVLDLRQFCPYRYYCISFFVNTTGIFLQEAAVHIPLSQDLYETVRDMVSSAAGVMSRPLVPPPQQPSGAVLRNPLGPQSGFQPPAGLPGPQNRHSLPPSLVPGKEAAKHLVNKSAFRIRIGIAFGRLYPDSDPRGQKVLQK